MPPCASMVKLVDTADLKFASRKAIPVRFRFEAPPQKHSSTKCQKECQIYSATMPHLMVALVAFFLLHPGVSQ
jgi:hypothetical protein